MLCEKCVQNVFESENLRINLLSWLEAHMYVGDVMYNVFNGSIQCIEDTTHHYRIENYDT